MKPLKYTITSSAGEDCTVEQLAKLEQFAKLTGLEAAAPGRYSILLLAQLCGGAMSGAQNPAKIVHEISALEGTGPATRTKRAMRFKGGPLHGLMHKHYLTDRVEAFAMNVKQEIELNGLPFMKRKVREAKRAGEVRHVPLSDVPAITRDAVNGYLRRGARQALTGDWLIYVRHHGKNYYLCVANHQTDQMQLRWHIEGMCGQESRS